MKFPLSWLKDYIDTSASLAQIAEKLTDIGLEVDAVEDKSAALKPFLVARILDAQPHPDAARLQICTVDNGTEKLQIVCGAPNARAGLTVALAPIGATIPTNGLVIKKSAIRGVESNGMLCSESELGIGEGSDGIVELPNTLQLGQPVAPQMGWDDPIIELNITPDRADCFGLYGVARDLAATGLGALKPITAPTLQTHGASPITPAIANDDNSCRQFITRKISGVKNGPSPAWMQTRLKAAGLRPISTLVDITNYFTLAYGRPLHVFDAKKLSGPITIRKAKNGEQLEALNDKTYSLTENDTVIADASGAIGLGGIIGGTSTGCDDSTTETYLEVAYFDPVSIALSGRHHQIHSDARTRFERGADPEFLRLAADLATALILELCGGQASELSIAGKSPWKPDTIRYTPDQTKALTGVEVTPARQQEILTTLGFQVSAQTAPWSVTAPSWRHDISCAADLVEEVTRIHGFEHIPSTPLPPAPTVTRLMPLPARRASLARRALTTRGLMEVHSFSFLHHETATLFGGTNPALRVANPISSDLDMMRPSLLPNLLSMLRHNQERGQSQTALCEVGLTFHGLTPDGQQTVAAGIRSGDAMPTNPHSPTRPNAWFDAKADALAALAAAGAPTASLQTAREAPSWYHPGRSGTLKLGKAILAHFGELHPSIATAFDVKNTPIGFETFLDSLPAAKAKTKARPAYQPFDLMPVTRDYNFTLTSDTLVATLTRAIEGADKQLIAKTEILSDYQNDAMREAKQRAVAIRVTFQPRDTTLTEADIDRLSHAIIKNAQTTTGVTLSEALQRFLTEKKTA